MDSLLSRTHSLLKRVEWAREWCGYYYCPCCERNSEDGHKDDCEMLDLLKTIEQELE
jgi:hypothetical protein